MAARALLSPPPPALSAALVAELDAELPDPRVVAVLRAPVAFRERVESVLDVTVRPLPASTVTDCPPGKVVVLDKPPGPELTELAGAACEGGEGLVAGACPSMLAALLPVDAAAAPPELEAPSPTRTQGSFELC